MKRPNSFIRRLAFIGTVLLVFGVARAPANAQNFMEALPFDVPNVFAVAAGWMPDYLGSDDYTFGVLPALNLQSGNRYLRILGNYASANILNHDTFQLGPVAYYHFGRDDDIKDEVVKNVHEIDNAFELGAFAGLQYVDKANPRIRGSVKLEFRGDVSDTHDGYLIQMSASGWYPVSLPVDLGIGIGGSWASDDYMSTYFGVTATDALNSGLPFFNAGSGMRDVYVQPMVQVHFSKKWHLGAGVRISSLQGDASDSPIVDIRGSDTQVVAGVGLAYAW